MGEHRTIATLTGALLALAVLTGCATSGDPAPGAPPGASGTTAGGSERPTGTAGTFAPSGDGAGAGADSPSQYGLNKRHHDRTDLPADAAAELDVARAHVMEGVAGLPTPVEESAVEDVLDGVGASDPWITTYGADGRIEFEAQVEMSGCLLGTVEADGTAEVSSAGWVLDGGCHALDGH